jgi:F0F1-type ATP synthase membrane subunit c/vacuolar-type H+-ATPase subunit K
MSAISRNPKIKGKLLTFMVLFVALVEVTAIYGLIISFRISGAYDASIDQMIYV